MSVVDKQKHITHTLFFFLSHFSFNLMRFLKIREERGKQNMLKCGAKKQPYFDRRKTKLGQGHKVDLSKFLFYRHQNSLEMETKRRTRERKFSEKKDLRFYTIHINLTATRFSIVGLYCRFCRNTAGRVAAQWATCRKILIADVYTFKKRQKKNFTPGLEGVEYIALNYLTYYTHRERGTGRLGYYNLTTLLPQTKAKVGSTARLLVNSQCSAPVQVCIYLQGVHRLNQHVRLQVSTGSGGWS